MPSRLSTSALLGITATPVTVEVDVSPGLGSVTVVGLADTAIQEARERVRSALKNSDLPFPRQRVTINLAPADLKKEGPAFDLPIALGILAASSIDDVVVLDKIPDGWMFIGELGLDGTLRRVDGVIVITRMAKERGYTHIVVPPENAREASLIKGIIVVSVATLTEVVRMLRGQTPVVAWVTPIDASTTVSAPSTTAVDFASIHGQEIAKRALEIAAAGAHNILMSGPPGSGKTLLARTLVSILPDMTEEEVIEVLSIYSVTGLLPSGVFWMSTRPFRSPHHTSSDIALVGGGASPRPGEVSLAHRGVLFLDELPEFARNVLEGLRQPLEDGMITVARAAGTVQFPAKFMMVASCNPCPCGYAGTGQRACVCSASQVLKYRKKISGPLLDRIDMVIDVPAVETDKLLHPQQNATTSAEIRERVNRARRIQQERFVNDGIYTNAEMTQRQLKQWCVVDDESLKLLEQAIQKYRLSARSYVRLLKLSRTIADLEGAANITVDHLAEALQYRPRNGEY